MPRLTKIYTRTGDDGRTALGSGQRVSKSSLRLAAYGTVDELNSCIGAVLAAAPLAELAERLTRVQNELFHMGAMLCDAEAHDPAKPGPRIETTHVRALEIDIDLLNRELPALKNFILPGGALPAALLHVARTVCRRAERLVVQLAETEPLGVHIIPYLNRLSDLLFVMARFQNRRSGVPEPLWDSRA